MLLSILLLSSHAFCQKKKEIVVGPGKTASKAFPFKEKYRYPQFETGYLITTNGKRSQPLKLNFNILAARPEFIDKTGDTLILDDAITKYIQIKELTYFHDSKDYFELVLKTEPVKLAVQIEWKIERVESIDFDGRKSLSRDKSNAVYSPLYGRLIRNENTVYQKNSTYFLIDSKEKILKANRSNFLKLFSDHKKKIEDFLRQVEIDYKKEEDLRKLFNFCIPLSAAQ